jgi:hypothetical protein
MLSRAGALLLVTAAIAMGSAGVAGAALAPPRSSARRSPRSGSTQFLPTATDYIPATVEGKPTVYDPGSVTVSATNVVTSLVLPTAAPSCGVGSVGVPDSGAARALPSTPFLNSRYDMTEQVVAGGWVCPPITGPTTTVEPQFPSVIGAHFTVALMAINDKPTVPDLSAASLAAITPTNSIQPGPNPGTVHTSVVTVAKHNVTMYVWQWPGLGNVQTTAAAEPVPHLQLTATTIGTTNGAAASAVKNLLIMLRTGAGVKGTKRGIAPAPTP